VIVNYDGHEPEFESKVAKLLNKGWKGGSGYLFGANQRDLEYGFEYGISDAQLLAFTGAVIELATKYQLQEFDIRPWKSMYTPHTKWLSVRSNIRIGNALERIASWSTKNDGIDWDFGHAELN
jgi:hypothetical protein